MPKTIAQRELRNDNARIMRAVEAGETFIVTRHGTPVAELRPIQPKRRTFVPKEDIIAMFGNGPHIDFAEFRRDMDAVIDPYLPDTDPYERRHG